MKDRNVFTGSIEGRVVFMNISFDPGNPKSSNESLHVKLMEASQQFSDYRITIINLSDWLLLSSKVIAAIGTSLNEGCFRVYIYGMGEAPYLSMVRAGMISHGKSIVFNDNDFRKHLMVFKTLEEILMDILEE